MNRCAQCGKIIPEDRAVCECRIIKVPKAKYDKTSIVVSFLVVAMLAFVVWLCVSFGVSGLGGKSGSGAGKSASSSVFSGLTCDGYSIYTTFNNYCSRLQRSYGYDYKVVWASSEKTNDSFDVVIYCKVVSTGITFEQSRYTFKRIGDSKVKCTSGDWGYVVRLSQYP